MLQKVTAARGAAKTTGSRLPTEVRRNQAGRPTLAELERRKATVMDVATHLFVTQGYAETSLVDIAKRAGVATRTLYQHFGDKEAIFHEVVFARRTTPMIPAPVVEPGETLFAALHRVADMSYNYVLSERSIDLMRLMVAESRRFPDITKRVAHATLARFRANIATLFVTLEERRQIPAGDHAVSARLFLDLVLGSVPVMFYGDWETARPAAAEMDEKVDLFIQGRFGAKVAKTARNQPRVPRRTAAKPPTAD